MVLNHYNLAEQPFGVTPNPRYLYYGKSHREAAASLQYGLDSRRGFTALIAHPGMGKTTLLFEFLGRMKEAARTVFLFQPQPTPRDLLRSILDDLGDSSASTDLVRMIRTLNEMLMQEAQRGRRVVVVIDEAQTFSDTVLEAVRMLSNFETPGEKLMHVILAGQPQLAEKLASRSLVQLRQRISIVSRLEPFGLEETGTYIDHRLRVAGYDFAQPLFSRQALALIHSYSGGVPRMINNLCFNAMSIGSVLKQRTIGAEVIEEVVSDLDLQPTHAAATPAAAAPVSQRVQPHIPALIEFERPWSFSVPPPAARRSRSWFPRLGLVAIAALGVVTAGMFLKYSGQPTSAAGVQQGAVKNTASVTDPVSAAPTKENLPDDPAAAVAEKDTLIGTPAGAIETPASGATTEPTTGTKTEMALADKHDAPKLITVTSKSTLYSICMENFGTYDAELMERIRQLNPGIKDPRHLKAGQELLIPGQNNITEHHELTDQAVSNAKMTGRNSQ